MIRYGRDLIFISQINSNGVGTKEVDTKTFNNIQDECFELNSLSLTQKTYVASGNASFIVRLKLDIEEWKRKADKWDALGEKIEVLYAADDETGEFLEEDRDLGDVGLAAASAFGYL